MSSKRVRKSRAASKSRPPQHWVGQPVVVVLKDGSYYIGELNQIQGREVTLSGLRANQKCRLRLHGAGQSADFRILSDLFGGPPSAPAAEGAEEGEGVAAVGGLGFWDKSCRILNWA